jgi:hypothetical protein
MEWISVTDRLPEIDIEVLVFVEGISYNTGPYKAIGISYLRTWKGANETEGIEWTCSISCNDKVKAWMPLPLPPKEK